MGNFRTKSIEQIDDDNYDDDNYDANDNTDTNKK